MRQPHDARLVPLRDTLVGRVLRGSGNVSYYLRECIGEGGQGWVFRANWDDPSGHVVIVKVLRPDVITTEPLRRFQREAEVLRMLSTQGHPNPYIVRFYDHAITQVPSPFGPEPLALPFTVLEYVDGTTLEKVLAEQKRRGLPAERVRRLLRQICQALDAVHVQKVVHRDLKPSNILLATEAGTEIAKVTDFGLVKLVDMNLQRTTALAGASLGYAPPEQYEQGNKRVSPRTDLFSLAAVTYEMLTGHAAFPFIEGENPLLIVTRILNDPRPTLMKARSSLPPELEANTVLIEALDREITRALSADPNARHESIMEFWHGIEPSLRAAAEERAAAPPRSGASPYEATARMGKDGSASTPPGDSAEGRAPKVGPAVLGARTPATPVSPSQANAGRPTPPPPQPAQLRVPEHQASTPAAWMWKVLTPPLGPHALRSVVFETNGETALAIAASGLLRWERSAWSSLPLAPQFPRNAVRGLRSLRDGGVLLFGDSGLVARAAPGGAVTVWRVPDPEITFHGALVEPNGTTTLVGERPYRGAAVRAAPGGTAGVFAQFSGDRIAVVGDAINCTRLRAVTRLTSGLLVACGEWGALVRVELGVADYVGSICAGHLLAIAPLPDGGAVTVGVGGHALSLSPKLEAQLEAVQTTRDLLALATTDDGQAWAGSALARLLRRSNGSWLRMSPDIGLTSNMVALSIGPRTVRAIGDDGVVVEGHLA